MHTNNKYITLSSEFLPVVWIERETLEGTTLILTNTAGLIMQAATVKCANNVKAKIGMCEADNNPDNPAIAGK